VRDQTSTLILHHYDYLFLLQTGEVAPNHTIYMGKYMNQATKYKLWYPYWEKAYYAWWDKTYTPLEAIPTTPSDDPGSPRSLPADSPGIDDESSEQMLTPPK
jgi:hypothetical protein